MKVLKELNPNDGLRVFDIKWRVKTAGPSPFNNERIEVFLLGCNKAMKGNPCKGCFNSITWDKSIAEFSRNPIELADAINDTCEDVNSPKYITIGGGEPSDQLQHVIPFVKRLKEHNFHIIMYTWRDLKTVFEEEDSELKTLLKKTIKYIDIIIDGEFKEEERLWNIHDSNQANHFVGSGNQIIWDLNATNYAVGYTLRNIENIELIDNDIKFNVKKHAQPILFIKE